MRTSSAEESNENLPNESGDIMTDNYDANGNVLSQNPVADVDGAGTEFVKDVVGARTDDHDTTTLAGRVHRQDDHTHKPANVYPTLAPAVTVTAGTGAAFTLGAFVEIVPASTITEDFDVHFVNAEQMSANVTYELVLYNVSTEIARMRITRDATQLKSDGVPLTMAVQPANSQIRAKVASSVDNADTINITLAYHTY